MNLLVTEQRLSAAILPQTPGRKRKPKTSHMKYGLFLFMIFMMITAVKVYLNYANIQQNITDVKATIVQRQRDMQYLEVQNAYYRSSYAQTIMAHQQGILLPGEQFVLFEYLNSSEDIGAETGLQENTIVTSGSMVTGVRERSLSPFDSRKTFFQQKTDRIP